MIINLMINFTVDILELVGVKKENLEVRKRLEDLLVQRPQLVSHQVQLPDLKTCETLLIDW